MAPAIGCQLTNSGAFVVASSFTYDTAIAWDVEIWKAGVTHSTVSSNSQITIITTGYYIVDCYTQISGGNWSGGAGVQLYINGAGSAFAQINNPTGANNVDPVFGFSSAKGKYFAGDVITIKVVQSSGVNRTFASTGSDVYVALVGT